MDDRCVDTDSLATALDRANDPAVRAHLAKCPSCRTLMASYRLFLATDSDEDADAAGAEQDLMQRIAAIVSSRPTVVAPLATPYGRNPIWRLARTPRRSLGLALAAAGLVIAVAFIWPARTPPELTRPLLLRGEAAADLASHLSSEHFADGSVRLAWPPHADAESYRVRLLSAELSPVAIFEVRAETTVSISAATIDAAADEMDDLLLWDVAPRVHGDILAPSPLQLLRQD